MNILQLCIPVSPSLSSALTLAPAFTRESMASELPEGQYRCEGRISEGQHGDSLLVLKNNTTSPSTTAILIFIKSSFHAQALEILISPMIMHRIV